jgi:hypothetical protein
MQLPKKKLSDECLFAFYLHVLFKTWLCYMRKKKGSNLLKAKGMISETPIEIKEKHVIKNQNISGI